ncbi:hypothetical protein [Bacteroides heparinolyticus]|uniref:hypothetical protein n=1 Tax=Prevotella heparinolytica TaxID=28113 RepID=UPI0023F9C38F|nr:hypothetical protein [Bacteroides heparinolyticus]MCI6213114.1 hypothetical protein [Bacteroides heparinolyticus]
MNDWIYKFLSVLLPVICTILGWVIYRKTEQIKIMENQLSDKKYKAYADVVSVFFGILKDTKNDKRVANKSIMDKMIDPKRIYSCMAQMLFSMLLIYSSLNLQRLQVIRKK